MEKKPINKIRIIGNKDTNYVFHMLSVSKCGYDNAYGNFYVPIYPQEDLALLKKYEKLITVCGGEHRGSLYSILVCNAACAKSTAKEYYAELTNKAANNDLPSVFQEYKEAICQISSVMIKHYDHFVENIWSTEQLKINDYIQIVQQMFENSDFTKRAEEAVGRKLKCDFFTVTLVTSVENGAEAIDISDEQDVFGIERTPLDAFYFIGHEFIVYLLFDVLKEENAFNDFSTWGITEGLAEYYLKQVMGDTHFNTHEKYVAFFEQINSKNQLNAVELYRKGLDRFL